MKLRNMTALYIQRGEELLLLYRIGSRVVSPSYCGIGGHFEKEELNDPEACVLREVFEETGITEDMLSGLSLRYLAQRNKKGEIRQNYYFFAELKPGCEVSMACTEGTLSWMPLDSLLSLEMPYSAKAVLRHWLEVGRYDDKIYACASVKDECVFTALEEF